MTTTNWTFTSATLAEGTYAFFARVEQAANASVFGASSATVNVPIDLTPPPAPSISGTVDEKPYQNNTTDVPVNFSTGQTVGDPTPVINVSFSALAAGEQVQLLRNGNVVATASTGTSLAFTQPSALNGITLTPTASAVAQTYIARRIDAAGNQTDATLSFSNFYLQCSQARAVAKSTNSTHVNPWAAGTAACTGCHSNTVSASGYIVAPVPSGTQRYWCSKP